MVDSLFKRRRSLGVVALSEKGSLMFRGDKQSDRELLRFVNKRLSRASGRVTAGVSQGMVTLTGTIQYEGQRRPIVKEITSLSGVRGVIDQLKLKPKNME
jgi:osmotically-inducible protein OsmY